MKDYSRLFDIIYFQNANFPLEKAFSAKEPTDSGKLVWKSYSTQDVINYANQVSKALLELGVKKDQKVALICNNRPEWNFIDFGVQQIGAVLVPIYPTITEKEYKFILNDCEAVYCFVSDEELFGRVNAVFDEVPSLKKIYTLNKIQGQTHWTELLSEVTEEDHKKIEDLKKGVSPEDLATLIYTSGTTGNPKGVMLTHNNIISNVKAVTNSLPLEHGEKSLSFLPLCHSFERMVIYTYMAYGMSVYYAESIDTIGDNLKEVKPNYFTTVPRLLEKVYERIMEKGNELTGFKRKLFFWSIEVGSQYKLNTNQGLWYNLKLWIARKLVFSKWQEALGGEVKAIITGAAALQPRLATLFTAAGIDVMEGYGLTETSPVLCANRLEEEDRAIGTVGIPIPGVEIKIADDGEILAKGPNIMKGYYNRPDLTAEVIDEDGWFHTGDIGEWTDGKFLKITDRKKELFKTSGGKYVPPQQVENKMKESPLIEQIIAIGNDRKFVSALIVPSFVNLEDWVKQKGLNLSDPTEMIKHDEVFREFEKEVERLNKDLNKVEQVKKFKLLSEEWSIESEELTPTLKLKRKIIHEKYSDHIEELYKDV